MNPTVFEGINCCQSESKESQKRSTDRIVRQNALSQTMTAESSESVAHKQWGTQST